MKNNIETEVELLLKIAEKAAEMRINQKSYFKYKTANYLNKSKILESELDFLLSKIKSLRENVLIGEQKSLF